MMPLQTPPDPVLVTPGVIGFAVTAAIAIATILLLWDLNRRIRDIRFRAEAQDAIAREQREAEADRGELEGGVQSGTSTAESTTEGIDDETPQSR